MSEDNNSKKINNTVIFILIIVGLILLLTVKTAVDNLTDTMDSFTTNISDNTYGQMYYSNLENRLDEIEEKISRQSSCIEDVKVILGACNAKNGMGKIHITVVPKEYTKDTKITVTLGEYNTRLVLEKKIFKGTIETPFTEIYDSFIVSIETDGKVRTEKVSPIEINEAFSNWDEELQYRADGEADCDITEKDEKLYSLKIGNANFKVKEIEKNTTAPVVYLVRDNKIIFQQEMTYNKDKGNYQCDVKETFEADKRNKFDFYAEYIGKSGLKYRVKYFTIKYDEENEYMESFQEYEEGNSIVYGVDGKELKFKYMDETDDE